MTRVILTAVGLVILVTTGVAWFKAPARCEQTTTVAWVYCEGVPAR